LPHLLHVIARGCLRLPHLLNLIARAFRQNFLGQAGQLPLFVRLEVVLHTSGFVRVIRAQGQLRVCYSFDSKLFYTHLDLCVSFVRRATSSSRSTENFFTHFSICACHSCAGPLPHVPFVRPKTFLHTSGFVRVIRAQGHFL